MNRIRLNRPIVVETTQQPGESPTVRELNPAADPLVKLAIDRAAELVAREARRQTAPLANWPAGAAYHDRTGRVRNDLPPPFEGTHPLEPATSDEWIRREGRDTGSETSR